MKTLDYLYKKARCNCSSDLRAPAIKFWLSTVLSKSDFMKFPLEDWEYAYCYIFNIPSGAHTIEQLYQQFMAALYAANQKGEKSI